MKKYYLSGLLIGLLSQMDASQQSESVLPPIHLIIHNNSQAHLHNQNSSQSYNGMLCDGQQSALIAVLLQEIAALKNHLKDVIETSGQSLMAFVTDHPVRASCTVLIGLYGWIAYQLYSNDIIIQDPAGWIIWLEARSLEQLLQTPCHALQSELLLALQRKYVSIDNPTDFVYPLVQFSYALEKEIAVLQEQINIYQWLQNCRSLSLFFKTADDIVAAQERLHKILLIKQIFASWCTEYKIEQNSRK